MKRLATIILCLILILSLTGCGGSAPASSSGSSKPYDSAPSSAKPSSPAPAPAAPAPAPAPAASAPSASFAPSAPPPPGFGDSGAIWRDYYIPNSSEEYLAISENRVVPTSENSMLTFSLKVDTASYRNVVRYIESGSLPPTDAVRIEEMINYFRYEQPLTIHEGPFSFYAELGPSPFSTSKRLAFVRVKSRDIKREELPPSNLTFLIDTSGSMNSFDKLPLLKSAFGLLVETLDRNDTVSIVTYAGTSRVALDSVRGNDKKTIMNVINSLEAGGSTAGANGIQTAYDLAERNYIRGGNNRVILATDGDFNVGISSVGDLERFINQKRETGVYLSILGVGTENIKDNKMETLAKNGNGNYNYLDSVSTAKKVLVDELAANIYVIADDVKAQVEFNPALVSDYRLIGYENRQLQNRDFTDDRKDAGEIGMGTDVILMFEVTLANTYSNGLKYGGAGGTAPADPGAYGDEFFEVRIRYKNPGEANSRQITIPIKTDSLLAVNTSDFNFASSVAAFGHLLTNSRYRGDVELRKIIAVAEGNTGQDDGRLRDEFVRILDKYQTIRR